jgi:glycosyltransferase involved in cell wall biosynthesis
MPSPDGADLVSVVIPTKDRRPILARTLATALMQRDVSLEVVVVDDGSSDDTPAWLAGLDDPRVRVVRHEAPRGVSVARNAGIDAARGEWIAFLDDDDLWAPEKLATQMATARREDADFVYAAAVRVDEHLRPRAPLGAPPPATLLTELLESNVMPAGQASVMARRELLTTVGGFAADLSMFADWDMWLRLAATGRPAACHEVLVAYVVHSGSMSMREISVSRRELRILNARHADLVRSRGRPIGGDVFWHWMVWGNRFAGRRVATARVYVYRAWRFRHVRDLARAGAALLGPPFMDFGAAWADRADPGAPMPAWLVALRAG